MRKPKTFSNHKCCPEDWRNTPDMTGSYELDAMIMHTSNRDMADRLKDHLTSDEAYKINNGYGRGTIS